MTPIQWPSEPLVTLIECYLGLESMDVTEALLELYGASIDTKALPLLQQCLQENRSTSLC